MTLMRRGLTAALVVGSMAGGALGATVISAASGTAATTSTPTSSNSAPPGAASGEAPNGGRFVPNENTTHEKGESAQSEAQESAGQVPTVP
jgi:hypothetical protein